MRMTLRIAPCVLLGAAALLLGVRLHGGAAAAGNGTMTLAPASQTVHTGDSVTVDLNESGFTNLAAWEVILKWDPSILSFDSYDPGDFLTSTGRTVTCLRPDLTTYGPGTAQFGCTSPDLTPDGPSGDGLLAHVHFTTSATGDTSLTFTKALLSDPISTDNCCIPAVNQAAIRVTDASSGDTSLPATPTPDPTLLSPTVVSHIPPGSLQLTPGSGNAVAPAQGGSAAPPAGNGAPSIGSQQASSAGGGSRPGGSASTSGGLFGDVSGQAQGAGAGAPHAGTGTRTTVRSGIAVVVTVTLGLASLAFIAAAFGARKFQLSGRRLRVRRGKGPE